jgi:hypothetical protein
MPAGETPTSAPPERDLKAQGAVLDLLLIDPGDGLTLPDLERELADEVGLSAEGAIGWALEDLIQVGLIENLDGRLRPTPAGRHLHLIAGV